MSTSQNRNSEKKNSSKLEVEAKSGQQPDKNTLIKRIAEASSEEEKKRLFSQLPEKTRMTIARSQVFSGPLPPPQQLKEYNDVLPGAADRILKMAERQSEHRQKMEGQVVESNTKNSRLGVIFAFLLGAMIIGGGIYLAAIGHPYGTWFSLGGVVSLVGVFVYGTRSSQKERVKKDKQRKN
ncbi:DUF2335 domain-containing protein [Lactiplantibacillus plantarum]|nr:DUF2335 domain-containing protein [Lactiplantibacillus plantarum]ERO40943.1 hypothetical protein LPLWJ_19550 [Lactiplantibacillus plantarum WJL]